MRDNSLEQLTAAGLERAFEAAPVRTVQLSDIRLVVFSDHHRGQKDGADDFARCQPAYHKALTYYLDRGFELHALGDVEELWECRPARVVSAYRETLKLEAEFHTKGRYQRYFGNHDDQWSLDSSVERYLHPIFPALEVLESLRVEVREGDRELGTLFLVHGHQGSYWSDRRQNWARLGVRYLWRYFQRLTKWHTATPATDYRLYGRHEFAMHTWASTKDGVLLVAGHTHHPVFSSLTLGGRLRRSIAAKQAELEKLGDPDVDSESARRSAKIHHELEELDSDLARYIAKTGGFGFDLASSTPCYFNAGCCCYPDGDITALEIRDGMIRLVRWSEDPGDSRPKVLTQPENLAEVLAKCRRA